MSFKSGFFNSLNGDRKYYASDFSNLIDSLVIDGVFASIGTAFTVEATSGYVVNVGVGKAWFNGTWSYNDEVMSITAPLPELLLDRIDAIVLEVNTMDSVRNNSISYITGSPASTPSRPTLTKEELIHQYPLCYIYRKANSSEITQADITNMVGTEETPFVTGILQTISLDVLLGQWRSQLDQFVANETTELDNWTTAKETEMGAWFDQMKADMEREQALLDSWIASEQSDFLAWFDSMKNQLSKDAAGNLQLQINDVVQQVNDITQREFERYYSMVNKIIDINKDSSGNTTSIVETSDEAVCTTTFATTDSGKTITTVCVPVNGLFNYTKTVLIETVESGTKITESYTQTSKEV